MAEELGWNQKDFDEAFREVFIKGMVKADFKARVVWIPNAVKHNRPESPNVVTSWGKEINLIPECDLKNEAVNALREMMQLIDSEAKEPEKQSYAKAFDRAFGKALLKASNKTMANQEQEQEQNKDLLPAPVEQVPAEPVFISFTLNDKTEWDVTDGFISTMVELYPAVDVKQELRNMAG